MPLDPFFGGPGLDRADLVRTDSTVLAELSRRHDALELVWDDGLPAVSEDGKLVWQAAQASDLFLGLGGQRPHFSAHQPSVGDARAAFAAIGLLDSGDAPTFAAALSLASWHARHRFCANCGATTDTIKGGWARRCASCHTEHFPRVDPVVIMLAEHDGDLLLGRQAHYPPNRYSALAGFLEVGETIEAAVAREFHEEAGIEVSDIRYVASQPWPFPSSLMVGCTARALWRDLIIDTTELEDARWFTRADVAAAIAGDPDASFLAPPKVAIARTLIEHWLA